jgi:hypothetical protein
MKVLVAMCLWATPAWATQWTCRNTEVEVQCDRSTCSVEKTGDFTPGEIALDSRTGRVSVCAYSGCWTGTASVRREGRMLSAMAEALSWSHRGGAPSAVALSIDTKTGVGMLLSDHFAQPVRCRRVFDKTP